jgi:Peptidase family S41
MRGKFLLYALVLVLNLGRVFGEDKTTANPESERVTQWRKALAAASAEDRLSLIETIKAKYFKLPSAPSLTPASDELAPALVQLGVRLVSTDLRPYRTEVLSKRCAYVRFGSWSQALGNELDAVITDCKNHGLAGLIVDLRTSDVSFDPSLIAALASRFVSPNKDLFELRNSEGSETVRSAVNPVTYSGPLAVVVNGGVTGNAEVFAAVLKAQIHALVIGQTTATTTPVITTTQWSNRKISIPAGTVSILGADEPLDAGLAPDIAVQITPADEVAALAQTDSGPIEPSIEDQPRRHIDEAALVAGTNPELDAFEAEQNGKTPAPKLRDVTLQRAVDFLVTVNLLRK